VIGKTNVDSLSITQCAISMTVFTRLGTRPEWSDDCIVHELQERSIDFVVVHTGQHYDSNLSSVFFEELGPSVAGPQSKGRKRNSCVQTASAMVKLEHAFREINPDIVLVEGDTNTVLAGALVGVKARVKVGMLSLVFVATISECPKNHNRRLTDHLSPTSSRPQVRPSERCNASLAGARSISRKHDH